MAEKAVPSKIRNAIKKIDLTGKMRPVASQKKSLGNRKVMVMGLDCAVPKLVFQDFKSDLPNLSKLIDNGVFGKLRSTIPPITIPAWLCMTSGKTPGKLGLYGFKHRKLQLILIQFGRSWKNMIKNPF